MKRKIVAGISLGALLIAATAIGRSSIPSLLLYGPSVGAGYAAEMMCNGAFVGGRAPDQVLSQDIVPADPLLAHATVAVDQEHHLVSAKLFGLAERTAFYRPALGCTLVGAGGVETLKAQAEKIAPMTIAARPRPWPAGDQVSLSTDPALAEAVDGAFPPDPGNETRALLVALDGHLLVERYGGGFDATSRLLGWSMSKSVTASLIGAMVAEGKLSLDDPAPVAEWRAESDPRHAITLRQLLDMQSGLAFEETYRPGDDATAMLYRSDDMAAYAAAKPLVAKPGALWSYSSGTANILARILREKSGGTLAGLYDYARTHLFEPTGMTSAVFVPDAAGNFVGSSYLYMTARDWARFGQLYLDGGVLGWQKILPAGWAEASFKPSHTSDGKGVAYARQFWLNDDGEGHLRFPDCPPDMVLAEGHNGQILAVIPSRHAVIVRLGWTTKGAFPTNKVVSEIVKALPPA